MCRSLRRRYFWGNMSADVAERFRQCAVCAKNHIHERNRTSFLKLFPASEPLEYTSLDILGPLPTTVHGNIFLLVTKDRFSKLTRTVLLRTISALVVSRGVLLAFGICLWSTALRSHGQRCAILCKVISSFMPRTRNFKVIYNSVPSPDKWSSLMVQQDDYQFFARLRERKTKRLG
jgi:Integrase zinc binding domain